LLSEGNHPGLGRLVGDIRVPFPGSDRRDRDDDTCALCAHERQDMLTGHNGAAQIDGSDAVECSLGDLVKRRVPAGNTHTDIVVKDVNAAPTSSRCFDHRHERRLDSDVRFECGAFSACLTCYGDCLLGGGEIVIDGQHLGAFLRETQNRGAAVAQALAWRLTGAYNYGDLVLETHANLSENSTFDTYAAPGGFAD
jgi:hypothetical protein